MNLVYQGVPPCMDWDGLFISIGPNIFGSRIWELALVWRWPGSCRCFFSVIKQCPIFLNFKHSVFITCSCLGVWKQSIRSDLPSSRPATKVCRWGWTWTSHKRRSASFGMGWLYPHDDHPWDWYELPNQSQCTMWCPPSYKLVCKPHEYYRYKL